MCYGKLKRTRNAIYDQDDQASDEEAVAQGKLSGVKKKNTTKSGKNMLSRSADTLELRTERSNSLDRNDKNLSILDRKSMHTGLKKATIKDVSVIAVVSREASENFARNYKKVMKDDISARVTKSSKAKVSSSEIERLFKPQRTFEIGTDFQRQIDALLKNKTNPHVIVVVEGTEPVDRFSLKAEVDKKSIDASYTRVASLQGLNSQNKKDNKQSMSVYVRDDMTNAYSVTEEVITHQEFKKSFKALGVNYQTVDGTRYRTLAVHIPNEFVGSIAKNEKMHQSFEKYALDARKGTDPVVVTSYIGDTNYKKPMHELSVPSIGGHSLSGETINPQSSSAKDETNFMQSIPLGTGGGEHYLLQPSTLNTLFIQPDSMHREAVDHPSILHYAAHQSEIAGRQTKSLFDFKKAS